MNVREAVADFRLQCAEAEKTNDRAALRESVSKATGLLKATIKKHNIDCKNLSIKELFCECFGWGELSHARSWNHVDFKGLMETAGAVSTAAFQNISGQITYGMVLEAYQAPEFVVTKMIPERQAMHVQGFEKIAGITPIGDETSEVNEGDDYPLMGVGENWIFFIEPKKKGGIVPLTKEAIFYDRTGQLVEMASEVGYSYGQQLEKAAVDCVIDENVTSHRYRWRSTTEIATYGDNSGTHNWDNLQASNALVDWTDIQAANQLLRLQTNPYTGEPILFPPTHLIVPTGLDWTARQILTATTIRRTTPGFATTGDPSQGEATNPVLSLGLTLVTTPYLEFRMATDTSWYLGAPAKAFCRNVHFPMEVQQAPAGGEDDFNKDIVMKFKVSGKMNFGTKEPRAMVKSTVA
jgi:hypothetical protein